ncbi:MAG: NAD(P)-dependent glycerol-3-phosphate dehydrogenase [Planctomycetota bacterium]|nr:NAD(P)-dependent glycerol-3-phosphate dehydrogenase [Planctomycetota bacterium]
MTEQVAIVGDGQMGLVLAGVLAERGVGVRLWGRSEERVGELAATRRSPRRLPGFVLPQAVEVTADHEALLAGASIIVSAIPTQFIRSAWKRLEPYIPTGAPVVSVSKGIENDTLLRPTQVIADATGDDPDDPSRPMCALSGPTIAAELADRLPATMVAASRDAAVARRVQELISTPWLRTYRHDDLIGVEIAGATKNVIALAAGMIDGLAVGYNAKSALLARGLAEIARLGAAMGAKVDTFFGVAGVGDLATTCFSPQGRNRSCGEQIGRGESLDSILSSTASVVEGVATTRSVVQLARARGVEMPITLAVYAILFDGLAPGDAIEALMRRERKAEVIG